MVRALIAHADSTVRGQLRDVLSQVEEVDIVRTLEDAERIFSAIETLEPDVILLGSRFQRISGLDILDQIMHSAPVPVIMVAEDEEDAEEEGVKAFSYGAVDILSLDSTPEEIERCVRNAGTSTVQTIKEPAQPPQAPDRSEKVVVIGASTGGPPGIEYLLKHLPADFPAPILIVQHMAEPFTDIFARRMNTLSAIEVREAGERERLHGGVAWIAPGDRDMVVEQDDNGVWVRAVAADDAARITPSIDATFRSAAEVYGGNVVGVVLSGMGTDGAIGARFIQSAGGTVLVESEATSLIFGIGQRIVEQGDADHVLPIDDIPAKLAELL